MKQEVEKGLSKAWKSSYIPPCPQAELISRDSNRGARFENIVYLGDSVNLAPPLTTDVWKRTVKDLGLN